MIKIWGRGTSINVQKTLWAAAEMGLEVERIDVGGEYGGLDTPEYGVINPNRRVPSLQDGDFYLWESNAIIRYLLANYEPGDLWPDDPKQRAHADQWMEWQVSSLWPALRDVFLGQIRTPPEQRNQEAINAGKEGSCELFQLLDRHLADRDYVTGNRFTAGDIPVGATCYRYMELDIDRPETPNVARWYERLTRREAFQRLVMLPLV